MCVLLQPTYILVTGAGRGFGHALCLAMAESVVPKSKLVLLGRNANQLHQTKAAVVQIIKERKLEHGSDVSVDIYDSYDCSKLDVDGLRSYLKKVNSNDELNLLVLHNVGTLGDPSKSAKNLTYDDSTEYMKINYSALVATSAVILEVFGNIRNKTVVNISTICAVQPFSSLAHYCSGKAAREMYMKVLAAENPDIRVLNYAPGPLATDMFNTIRDTSHDENILKTFNGIQPLEPLVSARRLVDIIKQDKYEQGQHVDYYDSI